MNETRLGGSTLIEYALLVGLVAMVSMVAVEGVRAALAPTLRSMP